MNKTIKSVLLIAGILLIGYGVYTMIQPEAQISIGDVNLVKVQDNNDSYITISLGIVAVFLALFKGKN